jgi:superfamily II DNA/RNA helicase
MVGALILSPTRELASQTLVEAQKLLTFHNMTADIVIGA